MVLHVRDEERRKVSTCNWDEGDLSWGPPGNVPQGRNPVPHLHPRRAGLTVLQLRHPVLEGAQLLLDVVLLLAAVSVGGLALLLQGQDLGKELLLQLLHLGVEGITGKGRGSGC